MFPLLLLLDAAVDCRSLKKVDSEEKLISDVPKMPHKVSDSVAEGVLHCLEELLKKCQLGSVDQVFQLEMAFSLVSFCFTCFKIKCLLLAVISLASHTHIHTSCIFGMML